jgi:hypothetical protein
MDIEASLSSEENDYIGFITVFALFKQCEVYTRSI